MSQIFKNNLEDRISELFSKNSNILLFQRNIGGYIDRNNEILFASSPLYRLYFSDDDREFIFKSLNITGKEITNMIKEVPDINSSWRILSEPFNILMVNYIRGAELKGREELTKSLIIFLALSLYSSLHFKYYRYLPNENAMNYTVNNMNQKFLLKKYGILYDAIEHIVIKNHETYKSELVRGNDLDIKNYLMNMRTRINNFLQIITKEYLNTLKDKKYLNTQEDNTDEENYIETSNISLKIEQIISKANNTISTNKINEKNARVASKIANVRAKTLIVSLEDITENNREKLNVLMRNILQEFLVNRNNSIDAVHSKYFINYMLKVYSKSNTKDPYILNIKKILDELLEENCKLYSSTEREATRVSYRKGVFVYFALEITAAGIGIK